MDRNLEAESTRRQRFRLGEEGYARTPLAEMNSEQYAPSKKNFSEAEERGFAEGTFNTVAPKRLMTQTRLISIVEESSDEPLRQLGSLTGLFD